MTWPCGWRRLVVLVLGAVLTATACTTRTVGNTNGPAGASGRAGSSASPASAASRPGPADRDETAVLAALTKIDTCALIDQGPVRAAGLAIDSYGVTGPHGCRFDTRAAPLDELRVWLGTGFDARQRFSAAPLDLAGFHGYL